MQPLKYLKNKNKKQNMKLKLFGKLKIVLLMLFIITAIPQLYASSCSDSIPTRESILHPIGHGIPTLRILTDTIPTKALKNALITADSLDRLVKENAALRKLDSISDKIIDTLVRANKLKEKQYKLATSMYGDCTKLNELLSIKNEASNKKNKTLKFWNIFFKITTVAAIIGAAVK